ncbi:MAG TPA: hypothetical protein PLM55_01215 [Chitinophagales bacterium]|nr:hypothetical protein [Chitinophagales bacterium]
MRFQKLITCFKQIPAKEKKQLVLYLHSPYFNVSIAGIALFDYLNDIHQSFAEKHLEFSAIKNKQPALTTKAIQDKAATELLKAIENFYVQKELEANSRKIELTRIKVLSKKTLFNEYENIYLQVEQQIKYGKQLGDFEHRLYLEELHQQYLVLKGGRKDLKSINNIIERLDVYYAIKKLRYLCELTQRQSWVDIAAEHDVERILKMLQPFNKPEHEYIFLWIKVFEMIKSASLESDAYKFVKQYLKSNTSRELSLADNEILDYAVSVSIKNINTGKEAIEEYLQWMALKEKFNLLLTNNILKPVTYQNLVICGLYANRSAEWLKNITQKYYPHLPEEEREYYYNFALGICSFAEKKYYEAAQYFEQTHTNKKLPFIQINRRWCFMSRYHYLSDKNILFNYLDSWRKQLSAVSLEHANAAQQIKLFISFANKLLKANQPAEKKKLLTALQQQKHFAGKDWIEGELTSPKRKPAKI